MKERPQFCPVENETPDPCPACGATVSGNDPVHGVCQARKFKPRYRGIEIILTDKDTGEIV